MPAVRVTMADVARLAGVSVTTVSHVLNETRFVADPARRRVLSAVAASGYTPNSLARAMATSTTESIGLALPAMSKSTFTGLLQVMENEVRAAGFSLLLADTEDNPVQELRVIQALHARRVDGVVIAPSRPRGPALRFLAERAVPTVVVDRFASQKFDQVGTENQEATARLSQHLAGLGHRRIALVSGLPGLSTTTERVRGFELGLLRSGVTLDPRLVVSGQGDADRTQTVVTRLLTSPNPPTAMVTANNLMTIGAMRALRALHLEVPRDLPLVAFDDFDWADLFRPRLTAIAQPIYEIGHRAVSLLLARIENPDRPASTVRIPAQFMHRESCGCVQPGARSADHPRSNAVIP
jgi:LacI family transcriptional regulator